MREQLHALPNPYWCAARPTATDAFSHAGCISRSAWCRVLSKCPGPDDGDDPVPASAGAPARLPPLAAAAAAGARAGPGLVPSWARLGYGGAPVCHDHRRAARVPVRGCCPSSAPALHDVRGARARGVTRWLNSDAVRAALHAAPRHVTGDFQECSSRLQYNSTYVSMVPVHQQLLQQGDGGESGLAGRARSPGSLTPLACCGRAAGAHLQRRLRPGHPAPGHRALDAWPGPARAPLAPVAAAQLCEPCRRACAVLATRSSLGAQLRRWACLSLLPCADGGACGGVRGELCLCHSARRRPRGAPDQSGRGAGAVPELHCRARAVMSLMQQRHGGAPERGSERHTLVAQSGMPSKLGHFQGFKSLQLSLGTCDLLPPTLRSALIHPKRLASPVKTHSSSGPQHRDGGCS